MIVPNKASLVILSKSENVGLARLTVATFASELDFTLNELEEIKVAVSEAVTNSIIHGYPGPKQESEIEIRLTINNGQLEIEVEDYGVGIADLEAVLQPSFSTKDQHMGLGLAFIDSFMDDFRIESELKQGTCVWMKKRPENKNG
ncbi:MAG: anti-sigma F factor [Halanaerobiaceae bacterium]